MNELNNALSLHRQGRLNEAEKIYLSLLKKIQYYCENRKDLAEIRNYLIKHKGNNMDRMKKFTKDFELLILSIMSKEKNKF